MYGPWFESHSRSAGFHLSVFEERSVRVLQLYFLQGFYPLC
jgi:hypothetical protein